MITARYLSINREQLEIKLSFNNETLTSLLLTSKASTISLQSTMPHTKKAWVENPSLGKISINESIHMVDWQPQKKLTVT